VRAVANRSPAATVATWSSAQEPKEGTPEANTDRMNSTCAVSQVFPDRGVEVSPLGKRRHSSQEMLLQEVLHLHPLAQSGDTRLPLPSLAGRRHKSPLRNGRRSGGGFPAIQAVRSRLQGNEVENWSGARSLTLRRDAVCVEA
jgi:hypothetical protein